MDLVKLAEEREGRLVAQRHVDDAVVGESAHGGDVGGFLAAAWGGAGDEDAGVSVIEFGQLCLELRGLMLGGGLRTCPSSRLSARCALSSPRMPKPLSAS